MMILKYIFILFSFLLFLLMKSIIQHCETMYTLHMQLAYCVVPYTFDKWVNIQIIELVELLRGRKDRI